MKRRNITTQPCVVCKVVMPLTSDFFYKNKSRTSGFCHKCKECYKIITPKVKYKQYRNNAKVRGLFFDITREEFLTFWQKNCSYCGTEIATIGLDRVDNSLGYFLKNIVPCCRDCNTFKRTQKRDLFLARIKRIAKFQKFEPFK